MGLLRITANGIMGFAFYVAIIAGIYGTSNVLGGSQKNWPDPVNTDPISFREKGTPGN